MDKKASDIVGPLPLLGEAPFALLFELLDLFGVKASPLNPDLLAAFDVPDALVDNLIRFSLNERTELCQYRDPLGVAIRRDSRLLVHAFEPDLYAFALAKVDCHSLLATPSISTTPLLLFPALGRGEGDKRIDADRVWSLIELRGAERPPAFASRMDHPAIRGCPGAQMFSDGSVFVLLLKEHLNCFVAYPGFLRARISSTVRG